MPHAPDTMYPDFVPDIVTFGESLRHQAEELIRATALEIPSKRGNFSHHIAVNKIVLKLLCPAQDGPFGLCAVSDGRLHGMIIYLCFPQFTYLKLVMTHSRHRYQGTGSRLVGRLLAIQDIEPVFSQTTSSNAGMQRIFQSLGFSKIHEVKNDRTNSDTTEWWGWKMADEKIIRQVIHEGTFDLLMG